MKRLNLLGWRNSSLKQKKADDIVNETNNALSFTIMQKGVGTRHAEVNATREKNLQALELTNSQLLSHWTP